MHFISFVKIYMKHSKKFFSFTLIEMLIVVLTIGILAATLIPRLQGALSRTRNVDRKNDLTQLYQVLKLYASENAGTFPQYATWLEWEYIGVLPNDIKGSNPCARALIWWSSLGYDRYPYRWPWWTLNSPNNYYPQDKEYFYWQTGTWWYYWAHLENFKVRNAIIGAYMEYESNARPLSNILFSSKLQDLRYWLLQSRKEFWGWSSCFSQAMYATLWIGISENPILSAWASMISKKPELINFNETIESAYNSELSRSYWTSNWSSRIIISASEFRAEQYPYTEWDYIMVVTPD